MNPYIEKQIGENVRFFRKKAKMTQDELTVKMQVNGCDITRSALAKIEVNQRHLYVDELILIKQLLNVSFEDLLRTD